MLADDWFRLRFLPRCQRGEEVCWWQKGSQTKWVRALDKMVVHPNCHSPHRSPVCRAYPEGLGVHLLAQWRAVQHLPRMTMRQKVPLNHTKTDLQLFQELPLGDLWPEAELYFATYTEILTWISLLRGNRPWLTSTKRYLNKFIA